MKRISKGLFKGTAWYYARYRPQYPKQLFEDIARRFRLDGTGRLLDLGCGTGELVLPLAKHFSEAIGVDPDRGMIAEAKRKAKRTGTRNVQWIVGKAEAVIPALKPVRLVVMGRSFHWMDRFLVLRRLNRIVEPNGGVVIVAERGVRKPPAWRTVMQGMVERYLGRRRRAGCGFYVKPKQRHEEILGRSPFRKIAVYRRRVQYTWTIRSILGYLYSTSYSSRRLFGGNVSAFERDLKRALLASEPSGRFQESTVLEALIARRPKTH